MPRSPRSRSVCSCSRRRSAAGCPSCWRPRRSRSRASSSSSYPTIGPSTSYTPTELACLRENAAAEGGTGGALSGGEASTESHLRNLRDGIEVVLRHPWGYGLGNAGVSAKRTGPPPLAGESTYTELGVDTGLAGALLFIGWLAALVAGLWRRSAWLAAAIVAMAAVGVQTDVIGVHWLAFVLFALAGAALTRQPADTLDE